MDGVGNRLTVLTDSTTITYTRNNDVNQYDIISGTNLTYDANGNMTWNGVITCTYDYANRLIEITQGETTIATYQYDVFGRRFKKETITSTNYYYYSGAQIIEEYDGDNQPQAKFVYGNGVDEILTMERGGHTYYYHTNALGSVTEITDENGVITESYKYDAYGAVTIYDYNQQVITTSAIGNIYYFTGRQLDNESGFYYYRARYYSVEMGRFLQRDPMGYYDSMNPYEYVQSNPTNFIDPYGLSTKQPSAGGETKGNNTEAYKRYTEARKDLDTRWWNENNLVQVGPNGPYIDYTFAPGEAWRELPQGVTKAQFRKSIEGTAKAVSNYFTNMDSSSVFIRWSGGKLLPPAITLGNKTIQTIHLQAFTPDLITNTDWHLLLIAHEYVHTWQYQQGVNVEGKGVFTLLTGGYIGLYDPYAYGDIVKAMGENKTLSDFGFESQASIIESFIYWDYKIKTDKNSLWFKNTDEYKALKYFAKEVVKVD